MEYGEEAMTLVGTADNGLTETAERFGIHDGSAVRIVSPAWLGA